MASQLRHFAEQQFDQVFDTLPTICILDHDGVIVEFNNSWDVFGQQNNLNQNTLGINYLTLCDTATGKDSDGAPQAAHGIRAVMAGDLPEFTMMYPCHAPHEKRWFQMRVRQLGVDGYILIIHENVTPLKIAEQQSYELALEREKVNLLRHFVQNISHDFRTPLTIINLKIDLLNRRLRGSDDPELSVIREQVHRLEHTLNALLTMFNVENPNTRLMVMPFHVDTLLEKVYAAHRPHAQEKGVRLLYHTPPERFVVDADQDMLDVAIARLLENAIFYTPTGGTVSLHVQRMPERLSIIVNDNGVGIPNDQIPYIFEHFYRVDESRRSATGGTGLGLAVAKKIMELHGGHIHVRSRINQGSTFTLSLPMR